VTQVGKAWEWWISTDGLRCGGEKPRESRALAKARATVHELDSEVELKSTEGKPVRKNGCLQKRKPQSGVEPQGGSAEPMKH